MLDHSQALDQALNFLKIFVAPHAAEIDRSPDAIRLAFDEMGKQNLMALKRGMEYGGPGISEQEFRIFQEECARASGTFAFLQTQHQSAASLIGGSENSTLKQEYLPKMGDGRKLVGIGFSQLRRPGKPIMTATPTDGGFILNGLVPWVTGWSYYSEFLIGATLPDGSALFLLVPLIEQKGIKVSPPMELAAMASAMTVSVNFEDFFVQDDLAAFTRPPGWITASDQVNLALQGHFAIGCSLAGLDVLESAAMKRNSEKIQAVLEALRTELKCCREATAEAQLLSGDDTTEQRLFVRAWAIDLAFRCAQAAVISSSGAANSLQHPAQRIYREALVFSVSAQTTTIMEASLSRLIRQ